MNITISNTAKTNLKLLQDSNLNKIFLIKFSCYTWNSIQTDLALVEQDDSMIIYEKDNFKFTFDQKLQSIAKEIHIDYFNLWIKKGFAIKVR